MANINEFITIFNINGQSQNYQLIFKQIQDPPTYVVRILDPTDSRMVLQAVFGYGAYYDLTENERTSMFGPFDAIGDRVKMLVEHIEQGAVRAKRDDGNIFSLCSKRQFGISNSFGETEIYFKLKALEGADKLEYYDEIVPALDAKIAQLQDQRTPPVGP